MFTSPIKSTQYEVVHKTAYDYASTVNNAQHFSHLTPRNTPAQNVLEHKLIFSPTPTEQIEITDYFGNKCCSFQINVPHDSFSITAKSKVAVSEIEHPDALLQQAWETALPSPQLHHYEAGEIAEMRLPSQHVECLNESLNYSLRFFHPGRPWLQAMMELTKQIKQEFVYDPKATTIYTPIQEVFLTRRGVCQDFAHLMLSCLRSLKLPARYVSGYILNEPPPGVEKLVGSDASHAWVECWLPQVGWIGFDPTNGKLVNREFITVAWGRDFRDVTPLRGVVLGGGEHEPKVEVTVTPLP